MRKPLLITLLALTAGAANAEASSVVTEPVRLDSPAAGIAAGHDGALWVTHAGNPGGVSRVTTTGQVTEFDGVTANREPGAIAASYDGALWFVEEAGYVGRVTINGVVSEFGPLAGNPVAITVGPDGNMWVAQQNFGGAGQGGLAQITPDGQIVQGAVGAVTPTDVSAGQDGAIWFAAPDAVGRVTMDGDVDTFPTALAPSGIAQGLGGGLWFAGADTVGKIGAAGNLVPLGEADEGTAITAGPDGAVWFTMRDAVGRVTPDGQVTSFIVRPTDPGAGITAGSDGAVWYTRDDKALGRVAAPPYVRKAWISDASARGLRIKAAINANALPGRARVQVRDQAGELVGEKEIGIPAGAAEQEVRFTVTGLEASTKYTAIVTAENDAGTAILPASTASQTAITGNGFGQHSVSVDPVTGETVVVKEAKGQVRVKPQGSPWVPLETVSSIPLGAVIDATDGEVRLESELGNGRDQAGFFHGGKFQVRQAPNGTTSLVLRGRLDCTTSELASVSRKRRRARRLWGRDSGGRFRTRGRDSIATVRGTEWLTMDTCGGTLTRVTEGAVSVRRIGGRRSVLVEAGEKHFAPHR